MVNVAAAARTAAVGAQGRWGGWHLPPGPALMCRQAARKRWLRLRGDRSAAASRSSHIDLKMDQAVLKDWRYCTIAAVAVREANAATLIPSMFPVCKNTVHENIWGTAFSNCI